MYMYTSLSSQIKKKYPASPHDWHNIHIIVITTVKNELDWNWTSNVTKSRKSWCLKKKKNTVIGIIILSAKGFGKNR